MSARFDTATSSPEGLVRHSHGKDAAQLTDREPGAGRGGEIQYDGRRHRQVNVTVRTRSNPSLRRLRVRRGRRLLARHAAMPRQRIESPNPDMSNGAA
jgi:hypothetical protein